VKVTSITVAGEVSLSREYQKSTASFSAVVELEPGDNAKRVYREVHKSLSDAALQEAHERLEQILCGGGL
jgi:hypothetical protein